MPGKPGTAKGNGISEMNPLGKNRKSLRVSNTLKAFISHGDCTGRSSRIPSPPPLSLCHSLSMCVCLYKRVVSGPCAYLAGALSLSRAPHHDSPKISKEV